VTIRAGRGGAGNGPPRSARRAAGRPRHAHAVRVAAFATLIIALVYAAAMVVFNEIDGAHLVAEVDAQLKDTLEDAARHGVSFETRSPDDDDKDVGSPPVLLWRVTSSGRVLDAADSAPPLPASAWARSGRPVTARLGAATFRLRAEQLGSEWLVAGQSLADTERVQRVLLAGELVVGPVLLAATFLGTLVVGLRASAPVEQARRHQLEFTADASHELRTPLTVIEAETALALSAPRNAGQYRNALERVGRESQRLHKIVDDLLWLARFDSKPANPSNEPVDLLTIAEVCADRFAALAASRGISVSVRSDGLSADEPQVWITAPPEWVDRLTGVLVDNACRYAGTARPPDGDGGRYGDTARAAPAEPAVRISVGASGNRVSLTVEDTGPGIPEEERPRLFDRFYRANSSGAGSGLGLAIADAVVRSTGGRWRIDDSPLGGARMQVTWHRSGQQGTSWRPSPWVRSAAGQGAAVSEK
jgi:signal transduction histidine kinase